ncbi:MAG: signal recognition particle protein [Armatimonadota bacterium]|nr:signal recognition particle protein [Armatimonadota bacterium]
MFETLTDRLQRTFKELSGRGKLRERDIRSGLKDVQMALLEADVNYNVVKDFVKRLQAEALGEDILEGLNPTQQLVKIVHDELVELLGAEHAEIEFADQPPTVILLCGLQGSGKTTTAAKLARRLQKEGHRPLLCATDVYRPAAIEQLKQVGEEVEAEVFTLAEGDPVRITEAAVGHARSKGYEVVIVDTAGRLHIDEEMMQELSAQAEVLDDPEVLLVVDAMTGQEAVTVAEDFQDALELDGLVLTKLDGDARGGAALSARAVTGRPIKYVGVGEKLDALEVFHPDRMASRILGMGDVLTLVEKAQEAVDQEAAQKLQERLMTAQFDLEDFRDHLRNVRKMGPLDQVMKMIPGMAQQMPDLSAADLDERELDRVEAIISSMTSQERHNPDVLNASRKRRIARGSGVSVQDVNIMLKEFRELSKMMKQLTGGKRARIGNMQIGLR